MELNPYSWTPIRSQNWYKYIIENTEALLKKTENNKSFIEINTGFFYDINSNPTNIYVDYIFDDLEYMKDLIFGLFQVDIENLLKMKHIMYQKLRLQPSEIEAFPYYEYEYTIANLKEWLEKEKEAHEEEKEKADGKYSQTSLRRETDSMMKKYGINTNNLNANNPPKMPNMNEMGKLPKI